jgi:PAS domain S-box-containing protein
MGMLALLFMFVLIVAGNRMHATLTKSLKLGFENQDLVRSLREEKAAIELLNESLSVGIRERKKAEEELARSEHRYRSLIETARDIIWSVDLELRYTYVSPSVTEVLGYTVEEIMSMNPLDGIVPSSRDRVVRLYGRELGLKGERPAEANTPAPEAVEHYHKDGSVRWLEIVATYLYDEKRKPTGIIGISRDITERIRAEEQIQASLREKDVMLREIHHRVKNNLQVMSSLLALQASYSKDDKISQACKDSERRVWSMALVHETLYRSGNLAQIDAKQYLGTLVEELVAANVIDRGRVNLVMKIEPLRMNVDTAVNYGLIANELISNCLQHAFPEGRKGEINVSLRFVMEDEIELTVKDNGVGLRENVETKSTSSFGLDLVHMLVDELDGKIEIVKEGGTEFRITLKQDYTAIEGRENEKVM